MFNRLLGGWRGEERSQGAAAVFHLREERLKEIQCQVFDSGAEVWRSSFVICDSECIRV